jgi:hypothetical protein
MSELDPIVPKPFIYQHMPIVWQYVVVDWLLREVPSEYQPYFLAGWRNKEVFDYLTENVFPHLGDIYADTH